MKNIMKCLLLTGMLLGGHNLYSQKKLINPTTDSVSWIYGRVENKLKTEALTIAGRFISHGGKSFLWIQDGADHNYSFEVKSSKGDWSDVEKVGELIYDAVCEGIEGTIKIYRQGKSVKIQLNFSKPDAQSPNVELQISSYSKS